MRACGVRICVKFTEGAGIAGTASRNARGGSQQRGGQLDEARGFPSVSNRPKSFRSRRSKRSVVLRAVQPDRG
eukprot:5209789-Alexandrium_andersonii.AAC.1